MAVGRGGLVTVGGRGHECRAEHHVVLPPSVVACLVSERSHPSVRCASGVNVGEAAGVLVIVAPSVMVLAMLNQSVGDAHDGV